MRLALYPGTFDPITNGHLDVLKRATRIFDEVVVAIAANKTKQSLFSVEERVALVEESIRTIPRTRVETFRGLVVEFARARGALALIRGIRAVSDYEYEFQMAQMNRHLDDGIETLFLMPNEKYFFTSSTIIKQVALYSEKNTHLVPPHVHAAILEKYHKPQSLDDKPTSGPLGG
jgi:pantetheine-phosphate adenylyltransferase